METFSSLLPTSVGGGGGLVLTEEPLKLSKEELKIFRVSKANVNNPKIDSLPYREVEAIAKRIRKESLGRLGHSAKTEQAETEVLRYIVQAIRKFPNLTVSEVIFAVDRGLDGEYLREGEVLFFSASNLVKWIRGYMAETKTPVMKKAARLNQDQQEEPEERTPTVEEERKMAIEVINMYLDMRKSNPEHRVTWGTCSLFNDLSRLGIYCHTEAEREKAKRKIREKRPGIRGENLEKEMRNYLYNSFIDSLLAFSMRLDSKGEVVPDAG